MAWSMRLGRFMGIDVRVHATFFLLLAWFGFHYWSQTGTLAGVIEGLTLILALFLCVVLHEYGHALTARRFGIGTRDITLLPFGGVAMLAAMPRQPWQEILVALAGPAVNFGIAGALALAASFEGDLLEQGFQFGASSFLSSLLVANLTLGIFNLLPAFPMDGGRVLRALLAMRVGRVRATRIAARVGQAFALGLGYLGFAGNPFLLLIAVFVWIAAGAEAKAVARTSRRDQRSAGQAMMTEFRTLPPGAPLSQAVDYSLGGTQRHFPVVSDDGIAGILTQDAVLVGLRDHGPAARVSQVMQKAETIDVDAALATLLERHRLCKVSAVLVTRAGSLVGLIDLDALSKQFARKAALPGDAL